MIECVVCREECTTTELVLLSVDTDDWAKCWHFQIAVAFCSDKCRQLFKDTEYAAIAVYTPLPGVEPCGLRCG